jgi:hypothetical protein
MSEKWAEAVEALQEHPAPPAAAEPQDPDPCAGLPPLTRPRFVGYAYSYNGVGGLNAFHWWTQPPTGVVLNEEGELRPEWQSVGLCDGRRVKEMAVIAAAREAELRKALAEARTRLAAQDALLRQAEAALDTAGRLLVEVAQLPPVTASECSTALAAIRAAREEKK